MQAQAISNKQNMTFIICVGKKPHFIEGSLLFQVSLTVECALPDIWGTVKTQCLPLSTHFILNLYANQIFFQLWNYFTMELNNMYQKQ